MKRLTYKEQGFTVVELIIVIAVIGILATILLIGFSGIQENSRSQTAKANATVLQHKLEAYASIANSFPSATSTAAYTTALNTYGDSSLSTSGFVLGTTLPGADGTTTFIVNQCSTSPGSGYQIQYYDFNAKAPSSKLITGSIAGTPCASWTALQ